MRNPVMVGERVYLRAPTGRDRERWAIIVEDWRERRSRR